MATVVTPAHLESVEPVKTRPSSGGGGLDRPPPRRGGDGPGPGGDFGSVQRYTLGVWIGIGGIVMFFAAMTSAMVVRKGMSDDWIPYDMPLALWASTAVLLVSSFTIEQARRRLRAADDVGLRTWTSITALLGTIFLAAQLMGWNALAAGGFYVKTNPSSSFFYVFTAAHGVHLLGGVLALAYVFFRVWRPTPWPTRRAAVEGLTLYWHFMDGLWVYLFVLMLVWR